ncbi:putative transferase [Helianthus anomalus]
MGPTYSISTACTTSNFCILNAANHIIDGDADMMLCSGSESVILPIGISYKLNLILNIKMKTCAGVGGFVACKALSEER